VKTANQLSRLVRARAAVTRRVRRLDAAVGRIGGRRRVLFETQSPLNLVVLRPLIDALCALPRVRVRITHEGRPDIVRALAEPALAPLVINRSAAAWTRFDLYVNADPWAPVPLHRTLRRLTLFHGVAGKYDLDCPSREARLFDAYDTVAFVNEDRMRRYIEGGVIDAHRAALVGYPKLDRLARGEYDGAAVRRALGLDTERPTIVYAPTWSPVSSLHLAGEAIIGAMLARGWNVIAKLHDNCFLPGAKYANGIDWRARLAPFRATERFALVETGDASPFLAAADLMVTDHSSIGFEFLALDRPLVVFDAPDLARVARINPEKIVLLRSAAAVVRTASELTAAVESAISNPSAQSGERRRVAAAMFHHPGTATARAVAVACRLLEIPQPADVRADVSVPAGITVG
jgi:hypothetical protein